LQSDPFDEPLGPPNVFLTLRSPYDEPFKYLQDTTDASFLSGIATFGGFWTFLNGAFALLFGANVVYFMFGEWNQGRRFASTFSHRLRRTVPQAADRFPLWE
jgi:hypothetical protein